MSEHALVFVYGTLRKGGRAYSRMADARFVSFACMKGRLVYVDRYPGLVGGDEKVVGEVYEVSPAVLRQLDEYEGCFLDPPDYVREGRECVMDSGEVQHVQVYIYQGEGSGEYTMPHGDWMELMQEYPELNSFE